MGSTPSLTRRPVRPKMELAVNPAGFGSLLAFETVTTAPEPRALPTPPLPCPWPTTCSGAPGPHSDPMEVQPRSSPVLASALSHSTCGSSRKGSLRVLGFGELAGGR